MIEELEFIEQKFNLMNNRLSIIDSIKIKINYVMLNTEILSDLKTSYLDNDKYMQNLSI
jgi:hypothetical protein